MCNGHAIECRLNAEDPEHDFRPAPGTVTDALFPAAEGMRYDTHMEPGARIPPFYDSMVAKVIAHGASRDQARGRLLAALDGVRIEGVKTNAALHRAVLADPEFAAGGMDTGYLGRFLATQGDRQ
jgi:acetyl-CoA carboxylase biotin carboxylase subunit